MILLDTNVVSQTMNPMGSQTVVDWMNAQNALELHICAPVVAEIGYGVARLPDGARKAALALAFNRLVEVFTGRILPFDVAASLQYGPIRALRLAQGRTGVPVDVMIAAIALTHDMTLATRNVRDFEGLGVRLVDPFEA